MSEGESERVDFKRAPGGVRADDLVALANSEGGGHLLFSIDEIVSHGAQIGAVRGCDVSDQTILQILSKAVSCIPPVSVDIFI
ncbi:AlbA family DNA-binding domain-containing protein [Tardiphaga sp. 285_C5_N1_2]|uniref:AlbA family DNA-binding domain-containing protein n=1 Tax=Tardiphaga sp. 285_C5_N1_2 TaxID=3240775 RepID=UPI003F89A5EA